MARGLEHIVNEEWLKEVERMLGTIKLRKNMKDVFK